MDGTEFFTIGEDLLDCVIDRLNIPTSSPMLTGTTMGAPSHRHVAIGEVVWDNCCDATTGGEVGGQVWVSIDSIYPSRNPPQPDTTPVACATTQFVMTSAVGLLRCWPTMNDNGVPPSPADLQAASLRTLADVAALIEGVVCCARLHDYDLTIGPSSVVIDGGCVGIGLPVTVMLGPCVDCSWQDEAGPSVQALAGLASGTGDA